MKHYFDRISDDLVAWRRWLHAHPEVGLELPETMAYIDQVLRSFGLEPKSMLKGHGIVVDIKGDKQGPMIAIRADADALPLQEESVFSYASTNENMHACGHDGHVAMALGAAKYFSEHRGFKGTIRVFFQPGEEIGEGALLMIEEGILEGVHALIGLHGGSISEELAPGHFGFKRGAMMAATDHLDIKVRAKGSHAAYPHLGTDPLLIASEVILSSQSLISREKSALEPAVLSFTSIHGGRAYNIIPDEVHIKGTLRSFNEELRRHLHSRLRKLCESVAEAHGGQAEVIWDEKLPPLYNHDGLVTEALKVAKELYPKQVVELQHPVFGGEDMAFYAEQVPTCFFFFSNTREVEGSYPALHHPRFDLDESSFARGSHLLSRLALHFLSLED